MNLDQVRNPHLIFPGQVLFLDKSNGRARLRMGAPVGGAGDAEPVAARALDATSRLDGIASIPFNLIEPFLNEAVIFETNELADRAAHRRDAGRPRAARRAATPPTCAATSATSASTASSASRARCATRRPRKCSATRRPTSAPPSTRCQGETRTDADGKAEIIPATFTVTSIRQEAGVGDRLAPVPAREYTNYAPHPPAAPIAGRIVSIYGDALTAGQNQIVALNRGAVDGIERGHVLALWRDGKVVVDPTDKRPHADQAARRARTACCSCSASSTACRMR